MPFHPTGIEGLVVFEPAVYKDDRGYFYESYSHRLFEKNGMPQVFVQDNQSFSSYGVVRGLHYQLPPFDQTKLVRALYGTILDVVVDIRKGSPTFGKSFSVELSGENHKQLFIPRGFAHGFSVLSETVTLCYKCDAFYNKESEGGIRYDDPALAIDWKVPAAKALVSEKDLKLPDFAHCVNHFEYRA